MTIPLQGCKISPFYCAVMKQIKIGSISLETWIMCPLKSVFGGHIYLPITVFIYYTYLLTGLSKIMTVHIHLQSDSICKCEMINLRCSLENIPRRLNLSHLFFFHINSKEEVWAKIQCGKESLGETKRQNPGGYIRHTSKRKMKNKNYPAPIRPLW